MVAMRLAQSILVTGTFLLTATWANASPVALAREPAGTELPSVIDGVITVGTPVGAPGARQLAAGLMVSAPVTTSETDGRNSIPPAGPSGSDIWLKFLVVAMLVAYQLRRKHRVLRAQSFYSH